MREITQASTVVEYVVENYVLVIGVVFGMLGVLAVGLIALAVILDRRRKEKLARSGFDQIDKMSGEEFEHYLAALFEKMGFKAQVTKYRGDYGIDIIIEKGGIKTAVQAKRYKGNVGLDAVQQAQAGMRFYHCQRAMVVTNSVFTHQAVKLAVPNRVVLWHRNNLKKAAIVVTEGKDFSRYFDPVTLKPKY